MDQSSPTPRRQLLRWWGALFLFTTLLCLLVSMRYFEVAHLSASPDALAFRAAMLLGHFSLLSAITLSPLLLMAVLWPRPRAVLIVGALWSAAWIVAMLVDTQVYQLYRFHINAGVVNLLFGGAASETFVFPGVMYAQAFAIVAGVALVMGVATHFLWRWIGRTTWRPNIRRAAVALVVTSIVGFHLTHIWADAVGYEPVLEQTAVLPLRYAATAKRFLRSHGFQVRSTSDFEKPSTADVSALAYPLRPVECRKSASPPNIVFIVIDSWRFDAMDERVTPAIASFARSATRFLDHHSGGNATRIGIFSLFYSIPGTYWHQVLGEQRGPVFIDELLQQQYDIQVFRSAPIYSPEFDRTVFADVELTRMRSEGPSPAAWDRDLTTDFLQYLEQREPTNGQPFFALLFYDAPHSFDVPADYPSPFQPSASEVNYFKLHPEADPTPLLNRYRNSVHYVDSLVKEALDGMRSRGLLDNTIVVVTGDHGQEFNDTGQNYWGHSSNFTRYQTGVPMLLYVPGRAAATVGHRTTHFDVVPTLLTEHLGCTSPFESYSVGRSLFDPAPRDPLVLSEYADFAIVRDDRIAVVREHGMQTFTPEYSEMEFTLSAEITRAALEQKTRFYKSAGWRSSPGHAGGAP